MFRKIRNRLFLSNLLVFALVLAGSAFVVRLVFVRNLRQQLTDRLIALAQGTAASAEFDKGYLESETKFSSRQLSDRQQAVQWFDAQGRLLEEQGDRLYIPTLSFKTNPILQTQTENIRLQTVTLPIIKIIKNDSKQIIGYIRVSQSLEEAHETIDQLDWGLAIGALFALVLSSAGGRWLNRQAMQPIESSFERLKQFTADASHELRSPLMAIITNAEVALAYSEGMRETDEEKFRAISNATEQMSQLTEDLLFLARTDKVTDFEYQKIDLTALLTDIVCLYQSQAEGKKIEFKTEIGKNLWLMGDKAKLTRSFTNLIQNAIQYTLAGGKIEVKSDRIGYQLVVTIVDTGIGIQGEHLDLVFERFWRADGSRSYYAGGSGLGLAITKAIVHNHGGIISVTSQLNVGSCFTVSLPVALAS